MDQVTKAKVSIYGNSIELEGTESFVSVQIQAFLTKYQLPHMSKPSVNEQTKPETDSSLKSQGKQKTYIRKVEPEPFEHNGDSTKGVVSLKDFIEQHKSDSHWQKILLTGYYITQILNKEYFTEGNLDFAFRTCKWSGNPPNMHQVMTDIKNKNKWLEDGGSIDRWKISRIGQLHVDDELSKK